MTVSTTSATVVIPFTASAWIHGSAWRRPAERQEVLAEDHRDARGREGFVISM
jgi:hypothetical protein